MRKERIVLNVLAVAMAFVALEIAAGQVTEPGVLNREVQGENTREITAPQPPAGAGASPLPQSPEAPNIGFIDSPSATCYQPDSRQNNCYINWYYMSVNASPNYMITMTTFLNNVGAIANVQGFFQTSMYVPYNMMGQGFRVQCGSPGAGGNPELGNAYAYTIRARDSANLSSANYGTVYCPAYRP